LAVLADVSFFFIPDILAQNDFFLASTLFGFGGFKSGLTRISLVVRSSALGV
jgi:hypothetical protein